MIPFLGTHQAKLDAKHRTSVPSSFRAVLRKGVDAAAAAVILRPSHQHPCIEGWPVEAFEALAAPLNTLDLFSEDQDDLATTLYGDAYPVEADKDGRIILPESLVQYAGLKETIVFMGKGPTFQIWEPDAAARRAAEARDKTRMRGLTLPGRGMPA